MYKSINTKPHGCRGKDVTTPIFLQNQQKLTVGGRNAGASRKKTIILMFVALLFFEFGQRKANRTHLLAPV